MLQLQLPHHHQGNLGLQPSCLASHRTIWATWLKYYNLLLQGTNFIIITTHLWNRFTIIWSSVCLCNIDQAQLKNRSCLEWTFKIFWYKYSYFSTYSWDASTIHRTSPSRQLGDVQLWQLPSHLHRVSSCLRRSWYRFYVHIWNTCEFWVGTCQWGPWKYKTTIKSWFWDLKYYNMQVRCVQKLRLS